MLKTAILIGILTVSFAAGSFAAPDGFLPQADSTWPMFHHDLHNTGLSPLTGDMDTCYSFWSCSTGLYIVSSLAIGDLDNDGTPEVVFGSESGGNPPILDSQPFS